MHYIRHRLTASVAYVTTRTYALTNDQWACPARPLVSYCYSIKKDRHFFTTVTFLHSVKT